MTFNAPSPIRSVLILKADRLYADVLRQQTERTFPRSVVTIVATVDAAAAALADKPPEIFVTGADATLEGDVLDLLARGTDSAISKRRVLFVTSRRELRLLTALRALEVDGVFDSASELPEQLSVALGNIADGRSYWSPSILQHMQRTGGTNPLFRLLTAFEQLVLSIVGDGCDDTVAADKLGLSPSTVCTVRRELHRKLGVQHRGELVRIAAQHGFVRFTPTGVVRPGFGMLAAAYNARRPRRGDITTAPLAARDRARDLTGRPALAMPAA